jgi:hypothetical protein
MSNIPQINLFDATMAELVALYNKYSGKPTIKKFKNLEAARARVLELYGQTAPEGQEMNENLQEQPDESTAPSGATEQTDNGTAPTDAAPTDAAPTDAAPKACPFCQSENLTDDTGACGDERAVCGACGKIHWKANGKEYKTAQQRHETQAKAVAESWKNAETAAKRKERHTATVNGITYKSVAEAFKALGLPASKRIPFRAKLKASGDAGLEFEHEGKKFHFYASPIVKTEKAEPAVKAEGGKKRGRPSKAEVEAKAAAEAAAAAEVAAEADLSGDDDAVSNPDDVEVTEVE